MEVLDVSDRGPVQWDVEHRPAHAIHQAQAGRERGQTEEEEEAAREEREEEEDGGGGKGGGGGAAAGVEEGRAPAPAAAMAAAAPGIHVRLGCGNGAYNGGTANCLPPSEC